MAACRTAGNARSVLDIGTGSGILCFAAEICGAEHSVGVEIDPTCLRDLAANRRNNTPDRRIDFVIGTVDGLRVPPRFDIVVMNLLLTESSALLKAGRDRLETTGRLIWSGLLAEEREEAVAAAANARMRLQDESVENQWWCGVFRGDKARRM
jgi:ribosomal protein L11 methyltransferase